jgi:hypothetical protein
VHIEKALRDSTAARRACHCGRRCWDLDAPHALARHRHHRTAQHAHAKSWSISMYLTIVWMTNNNNNNDDDDDDDEEEEEEEEDDDEHDDDGDAVDVTSRCCCR